MIIREIINKNTGDKLIMFEDCDFEYEIPIKHYSEGFIVKEMALLFSNIQKLAWRGNLAWRKTASLSLYFQRIWYRRSRSYKANQIEKIYAW